MAEWFKRGTVNTFYRGSNPLKTLKSKVKILFKIYNIAAAYKLKMNKINSNSEHVEILVNNLLLSRSGSDSLRVRVSLFVVMFQR